MIHWCRGVDRLEVERTVVSDGVHKLRLLEAGEAYVCYLVANETGHFCYHVADASELVAALLVAVVYRSGFHLCILSRGTGCHSVRAFGRSVEVKQSICFDAAQG